MCERKCGAGWDGDPDLIEEEKDDICIGTKYIKERRRYGGTAAGFLDFFGISVMFEL